MDLGNLTTMGHQLIQHKAFKLGRVIDQAVKLVHENRESKRFYTPVLDGNQETVRGFLGS